MPMPPPKPSTEGHVTGGHARDPSARPGVLQAHGPQLSRGPYAACRRPRTAAVSSGVLQVVVDGSAVRRLTSACLGMTASAVSGVGAVTGGDGGAATALLLAERSRSARDRATRTTG